MRRVTTSGGTAIDLDGDVLAILEAISLDLRRRKTLDYSFEDIDHEFQHVVAQMSGDELRVYLKESLFMSFNRFENERLMTIVKKGLGGAPDA